MAFVKLLFAWVISIAVCAALSTLMSSNEKTQGGFVEAALGIGVLVAIPSLVFALIVGWPIMAGLSGFRPVWLIPVVAMVLLAIAMLGITALLLPAGWRGASSALVIYAAILGLVWGCLNALTAPASAAA